MKRIYVSYRLADTSESYGRILERLKAYFGSEATLRSDTAYTADGATLPPSQYRAYVASAMRQCAALLLIIGPRWLESGQPGGWSLSELDDPVRIEIEAALREGVPIVPALVQQGRMPRADELPASLRLLLEQDQEHTGKRGQESLLSLVSRSGMQMRRDPDFEGDTQRLCEVIENLAGLEATSLERASGTINRMLRNVTLATSATLIAHAAILSYFALQTAIPLPPALAIPTTWLPTIIITSLIDWGIYFLAGYVTGRRTGDVGLGVSAAVTSYLIGLAVGIIAFADITWSKWTLLSATIPTPALLVGAPDWLLGPSLLLMRPFILLFTLLALGMPLGLLASFALGSLGGIMGARVTEVASARQRARERDARIQSETETGARRGLSVAFHRRSVTPDTTLRRRATPAGKVFISYRRDDSAVMCGSIYDRLTEIFGVDTIFKDVDMIPVGANFEKFITTTLEQCVAQVVVIGPRWVSIATMKGERRLDDPTDFVRLEVESALRSGLKVIPVLVSGATMPAADELPESLRPLAELTPAPVRYIPHFDGDMRDLGLALAPTVWPAPTRKSLFKRLISLRAGLRATQAAVFFWLALFLAYGVILGVETVHALSLPGVRITPSILTFLGAAPVIMTLLAAISGAHLGYTTGRTGQSFWLVWRAVLLGCAALALTTQILGATRYQSAFLAAQDPSYREFATGALVAAAVIGLGPAMVATLLGAAISAIFRRRRSLSARLTRAPRALQVVYRADDAGAGARVTQGLRAYFGRRVLPPKRLRLQNGDLGRQALTLRLASFYRAKVLPLMRMRSLNNETSADASARERDNLTRALGRSAAMLVLVGPGWTASGNAVEDMSDPENPLRVEIETALALGRPIVPVLLTDATMASPDQLPASMREFAMLNAAWVRDEPDYPGDMRRLTRVIERLTGLREARRPSAIWTPILLGVILSALALIGADAVAAQWLLSTSSKLNQNTWVVAGGGLLFINLLVYGVTGGLVTRWSGRRLNGALAAMLGAALTMLAGVEALRQAQAGMSITPDILNTIALYLVIRLPFQTLGALAASALGSVYGQIAYRRRERRRQERRLYGMARAMTQSEPLAEMSARSARATGGATARPITPQAVALAASAVEASPVDTAEVAPTAVTASEVREKASEQLVEVTPADSEDTLREKLLSERRANRLRARTRTRIRLGVAAGLVAATLLIVSLISSQVYVSQVNGINADATSIAQRATAVTNLTATVVNSPLTTYSSKEPGLACDLNGASGAWSLKSASTTAAILCGGINSTLINSSNDPIVLALTLDHPYAIAYELQFDLSFLDPGSCAGLVANGQRGSASSAIEYVVCKDGGWSIAKVYADGAERSLMASGDIHLRIINHLTVRVYPHESQFFINGRLVKSIFSKHTLATTDYTGICMNWGRGASGEVAVEASNFSYAPLPSTPA